MKAIKDLVLLLLAILSINVHAIAPNHLDLAIIFDKGISGVFPAGELNIRLGWTVEVMTVTLATVIDQGIPVIANNHLIKNLILVTLGCSEENALKGVTDEQQRNEIQANIDFSKKGPLKMCTDAEEKAIYESKLLDKIKRNYSVYISANKELPLTLLLPTAIRPEAVGINTETMRLVPTEKIASTYLHLYTNPKEVEALAKPIRMDLLKKWFIENSNVPKRIFAMGHGMKEWGKEKGYIAQLYKEEYVDFLKLLIDIGTQLLLINSCFAGGKNLADMHSSTLGKEDQWLKDVKAIKFIIVSESSTEEGTLNPKFRATEKLNEGVTPFKLHLFFEELDRYFKGTGNLGTAISQISGNIMQNMPSIRFPGAQGYFRPVQVEKNFAILTFVQQQAKKIEKKPIIVPQNKTVLMLYPVIHDVPIELRKDEDSPLCIWSMVNPSVHIFDSLSVDKMSMDSLIASLDGIGARTQLVYIIKSIDSSLSKELTAKLSKIKLPQNINEPVLPKHIIVKFEMDRYGVAPTLTVLIVCKTAGKDSDLIIFEKKPSPAGTLTWADADTERIQNEYFGKYVLRALKNEEKANNNNIWQYKTTISPKLVRGGYPTELKKIKDIVDLFKNAYPTNEAIRQATGGNQTLKMLKDAIVEFFEDATGSPEYIKEMVS